MFEVGQQVVCVNDGLAWGSVPHALTRGAVYTVIDACSEIGGILVDVPSPHYTRMWAPSRFRPVTRTRDTLSIESFMTIKTGQPEGPRRVVGPVSPKKERA